MPYRYRYIDKNTGYSSTGTARVLVRTTPGSGIATGILNINIPVFLHDDFLMMTRADRNPADPFLFFVGSCSLLPPTTVAPRYCSYCNSREYLGIHIFSIYITVPLPRETIL